MSRYNQDSDSDYNDDTNNSSAYNPFASANKPFKRLTKRSNRPVRQAAEKFLDVEASSGEESDEVDQEYKEDYEYNEQQLKVFQQYDERRRGMKQKKRVTDVDEIQQEIEDAERMGQHYEDRDRQMILKSNEISEGAKNTLLPSVNDPNMFIVK